MREYWSVLDGSVPASHIRCQLFYIAYGIGGVGVGGVYGACIGLALKWFYNRRGLCVGVVAGSYGFGTALTAIPVSHMINVSGYRSAFITWGIIQGLVVLIVAQFLFAPQADWLPPSRSGTEPKRQSKVKQSSRSFTPAQMVKNVSFYVIYSMMIMVTFSGLMLTFQLQPIAATHGFDKFPLFGGLTVLTFTLTLNQILNGSARPFFGFVADRLGRYDTMALVFSIEAIALVALTSLVAHPAWFIIISGVVFFAWGDVYSSFPSAIADIFGVKHATTNYGIQYTAKGIGAILAAPGAAWLVQVTGSWTGVFWTAVGCNVAAALLAVFWLKPHVTRLVKSETMALSSEENIEVASVLDDESAKVATAK